MLGSPTRTAALRASVGGVLTTRVDRRRGRATQWHRSRARCPRDGFGGRRLGPRTASGRVGRRWQLVAGPERSASPDRRCRVPLAVRRMRVGAGACQQLIGAPPGRSGYDCSVEGSRGEAGGSLRLAAALLPLSPGALVCGRFGVARGCAGSRVTAGRFAGHCGDARPLAVFV
jgi:hypothetical protein